jgi:thiol-disulfide isomerase/thioredoxin
VIVGGRPGRPAPRSAAGPIAIGITTAALAVLFAAAATGETGATAPAKKKTKARASATAAGRRPAPDIGVSRWLHTPPLRPADLKGKPRLVAFWTFGCENCKRTVPALREIQFLYAKRGLLILGVHTPEFPHERDSTAVAAAAKELGLTFPIALDDEYVVWKAFKNRYWPALYLVDRSGAIRASHIGELHLKTSACSIFDESVEEVLDDQK